MNNYTECIECHALTLCSLKEYSDGKEYWVCLPCEFAMFVNKHKEKHFQSKQAFMDKYTQKKT